MENIFKINGYTYITNEEKMVENDIILSSYDHWTDINKDLKPTVSILVRMTNESYFVNFLTKNKSTSEIDLRTKKLAEWFILHESVIIHKKIIQTNNPKLIKLGVKKIDN